MNRRNKNDGFKAQMMDWWGLFRILRRVCLPNWCAKSLIISTEPGQFYIPTNNHGKRSESLIHIKDFPPMVLRVRTKQKRFLLPKSQRMFSCFTLLTSCSILYGARLVLTMVADLLVPIYRLKYNWTFKSKYFKPAERILIIIKRIIFKGRCD